ncbi:MAG: hypothetical protein PHS44_02490, partial [Candidatus Dojkabacteria bacterium]|nr:hypothetical protein [Candidatus Dojkabacteria bacterium]
WQYLDSTGDIKVNSDKELFTAEIINLLKSLPDILKILGRTRISITTLFPFQDRWVSRTAGYDLERMLGREIANMAFDLPPTFYPHFKATNAHDLVAVWAPYIMRHI